MNKLEAKINTLSVAQIKEVIVEAMKIDSDEHMFVTCRALSVLEDKISSDEFYAFCESLI